MFCFSVVTNVAIEVSLSRPRWSRQEVRCCNRFGLGRGFYVTTECFYVVTEFDQGQGILCRDREFLCRTRISWSGVATKYFMSLHGLVKTKRFYVATENSMSRQSFLKLCCDRVYLMLR